MDVHVPIGDYIIQQPRVIRRCPSYYAADWERLELQPGRYPLSLVFVGGYMIPLPKWISARIPSVRVDGALYSGCAGNIFARHDLPKGEKVDYLLWSDCYLLPSMVQEGAVELFDGFDWAIRPVEHVAENHWTWEEVKRLASERPVL
jgi:hypothetical protein